MLFCKWSKIFKKKGFANLFLNLLIVRTLHKVVNNRKVGVLKMADSMSQEEINMLINSFNEDANEPDTSNKVVSSSLNRKQNNGKTSLYKTIDFRKPNKLQYDNLGALKQIHEQFAKSLNNYLTMFLRTSIQVDVDFEIIEQLAYQQYVSIASKNCLWGIYGTSPSKDDEGKCFLQFDTAFCDFFIDRSFGGSADYEEYSETEDRKMADINKEISKSLFLNVLNAYEQAWTNANIMDFKMSLITVEDNVQNLNLGVINSEMMLIIPIVISIFQKHDDDDDGETKQSIFKIGIPYNVIEPVLDKLNISNMLLSHRSDIENDDVKHTIQKMSNLVEVYVGETEILFSDLLYLSKGDVLLFEKKKTDPYDVNIGGIKKYNAKPYRIKNSICMQIIK